MKRERNALAALVAEALSDGRLAAELDKLGYDLVEAKENPAGRDLSHASGQGPRTPTEAAACQ
jgi:hypothetical protein